VKPCRPVAGLALAALLFAGAAGAASLKGVEAPDSVQVEGQALALQGLGLRKKFFLSVYVGALYLATPTSDAAAAIAADEPKRIALWMLRDVEGPAIAQAVEEGFFKNAQEQLDRLQGRTDRLKALFVRELREGQQVSFTYAPGPGTAVAIDGAEKGVLPGRDFMEALWAVWLGALPVDYDLKKGMLGGR